MAFSTQRVNAELLQSLSKTVKSLHKTVKLQNNFDSQLTLKTSKFKLLDSQISTDYQASPQDT